MRILHVITTLDTGGAEHLMVDLLPLLIKKGNQVDLLLFNGVDTPFKNELAERGVNIFELTNIAGNVKHTEVYNPMNVLSLRKYLRDYDIIHTHNTACQFYVPLAKHLTKSNAKLVTTEHNTTNRRRSIRLFKPIDKWMYNQYKKVICIGDLARKNLIQYLGPKARTCTIYNGINIDRFIHPIKDISKKSRFIITMVAAFRPQKDHATLIKAFTHLNSNYHLQFVGTGETEQEMKILSREYNLDDKISFLGSRSDVSEVLEKSDLIVLSSHWEGLSLSSIEGMASGRPFIASEVEGLTEVVAGAGVLFPHGDERALANCIEFLCNNPSDYQKVAESCQERAKEYDINKMANAYNALYETL